MKLFKLLLINLFFITFISVQAQDVQVSNANGYSVDFPHVALGTENANLIYGTNFYYYSFPIAGPAAPISDPVRPSEDAYGPNTTSIAVNYNSPNQIAIAYMDFHYQYDPVVQFYGIYLVKSNDGGATWETPELIDTVTYGNSISNLSYNLPVAKYDDNGHLYLFYRVNQNTFDENALYLWKDGVRTRIDDQTNDDFETAADMTVEGSRVSVSYGKMENENVVFYLRYSTDGGNMFSDPILVKNEGNGFLNGDNFTKAFCNLDGTLEYVCSYFNSPTKWYFSDDNGANWTEAGTVDSHQYLSYVAIKRADEGYYMKVYVYNQNVYMSYGSDLNQLNYEGMRLNSVEGHESGGDYIDFTISPQLNKYAVSWQDDRTGHDEIFYASGDLPPLVGVTDEASVPNEFKLEQNYPNPFSAKGGQTTTINYTIPTVETGHALAVQLNVYDILGHKVATLFNGEREAGKYSVTFNASNLPSGIYFYTLRAGDFTATKKMILMK